MRANAIAGAAVLSMALSAVGCGGQDDTVGGGTPSISRQDFILRADKICGDTSAKIRREAVAFFKGGPSTPEQDQRFFLERAYALSKRQDEQIRALGAPRGDEAEVKALLDEADAELERVKGDPALVRYLEAEGPSNPFAKANDLARRYGLSTCAD